MDEIERNNFPIRRCPSCRELGLKYDTKNNQFICEKCGYLQKIPVFNRLINLFKKS